jgi:hypothetical protein
LLARGTARFFAARKTARFDDLGVHMANLRPSFARAPSSALRPLAILFLSSALAFACGDNSDDGDKNTLGAGAAGANPATNNNPSTAKDAGAATSPLGGLGGLLGDASFDPATICAMNPELCVDGGIDPGAIASNACKTFPELCSDAGGLIGGLVSGDGGLIGGLGGFFGGLGTRDSGTGGATSATDSGTSDSGASTSGASDSGATDSGSSDAGADAH